MNRAQQFLFAMGLPAAIAAGLLIAGVAAACADPGVWKGEGWNRTDFSRTTIKWSEIRSGGPPKDGIPSIDNPKFIAVAADKDLTPRDPVIGLEINGEARAYPLRVLIWHEIVNDVVGGVPVAVTYCPLCNSAIVFDRRMNGKVLDFGTTGKLRNSDLVMYDRQSESWWQQFTGRAIVGAMTGSALKILRARLESFAQFKARHPGGALLVPGAPDKRAYGANPYAGYDSSSVPFLYDGEMPRGVEPLARVVVIKPSGRSGGDAAKEKPAAVTLAALRAKGRYRLGDVDLSWRKGQASALDSRVIAKGREVGTVTATRKGPDGEARPVPYDVTFAFVFHAFHPQTPIARN